MKAKHNGRLEQWSIRLQEYNFEIEHRPGKSNVVADALSRRTYDEQTASSQVNTLDTSMNQADIFEPAMVEILCNEHVNPSLCPIEQDSFEEALEDKDSLSQLQQECPDFSDIFNYLRDNTLPEDKTKHDSIVAESRHFSIQDDILYHWFQRRCKKLPKEMSFIKQIALPKTLRLDALLSYHDCLAGGGHLGIEKVKASLNEKLYWPKMHNDITQYVRSCVRCQKAKRSSANTRPPLTNMPQVSKFERWHVDILGPITKTNKGHQYILLCVDSYSRWPEAFPLKTMDSKEIAAKTLQRDILPLWSPKNICVRQRTKFSLQSYFSSL